MKARGSPTRAKAVKEMRALGLFSAGRRSMTMGGDGRLKTVFSEVKRISLEHVAANNMGNMIQE
jgi:hypothetical protein